MKHFRSRISVLTLASTLAMLDATMLGTERIVPLSRRAGERAPVESQEASRRRRQLERNAVRQAKRASL